jgi:hypothetical protein
MKRITLILGVVAVMVAMLVALAAPAMANGNNGNGNHANTAKNDGNHNNGDHNNGINRIDNRIDNQLDRLDNHIDNLFDNNNRFDDNDVSFTSFSPFVETPFLVTNDDLDFNSSCPFWGDTEGVVNQWDCLD